MFEGDAKKLRRHAEATEQAATRQAKFLSVKYISRQSVKCHILLTPAKPAHSNCHTGKPSPLGYAVQEEEKGGGGRRRRDRERQRVRQTDMETDRERHTKRHTERKVERDRDRE